MNVIAGDIGGTRSRLAWYDGQELRAERTYASKEFSGLEAAVRRFLEETKASAEYGCFALAGPVRKGVCITTNLPWRVEERVVAETLGFRSVRLVNDFAAQAVGVTLLRPGQFEELLPGVPDEEAPVAVLGAGTGLGEAYVLRTANGRVEALPGEGGHADFAPVDERQMLVLRELQVLLGTRISYERVLSGPGLYNIYRALRQAKYAPERPEVAKALESEDPGAVLSREALAGDTGLCGAAMEVFVEVYAQEASNMVLRTLARGGAYLAGGVAPKNLAALRSKRFEERFRQKAPHTELLREVPVRVVLDTMLGLRGAAQLAVQLHS